MRCSRRVPSKPAVSRLEAAAAAGTVLRGLGLVDGDLDVLFGGPRDFHGHGYADDGYGEADEDEEDAGFVEEVSGAEGFGPVGEEEVERGPDEPEGLDGRSEQSDD